MAGCAGRHAQTRSAASLLLLTISHVTVSSSSSGSDKFRHRGFLYSQKGGKKLNNKQQYMISDFITDCCDSTESINIMQKNNRTRRKKQGEKFIISHLALCLQPPSKTFGFVLCLVCWFGKGDKNKSQRAEVVALPFVTSQRAPPISHNFII